MNESVSKWFIEVFFAIMFAAAVVFSFRLVSVQSGNTGRVNDYSRQGVNGGEVDSVEEQDSVDSIVNAGNVVKGSSIYYDVISAVDPDVQAVDSNSSKLLSAVIVINGTTSTIPTSAVLSAMNGDPSEFMQLAYLDPESGVSKDIVFSSQSTYVKNYILDTTGRVRGVSYTLQ